MPKGHVLKAWWQLRRMLGAPTLETDSDSQLLELFADQRDETAFATLLQRHGPMVLGVCQRVLNNAHAAEDAFQATFLLLARKAPSILRRDAVGGWLYRVAYHTALKAKASMNRRRAAETEAAAMPILESSDDAVWRDLRPVLDEVLNGLPEKYRAPIVLCYLEGRAYEEAARQLGCPKGTLSIRLSRAREVLRDRLTRRGLALTGPVLATVLTAHPGPAALPPDLAASTMHVVCRLGAGATSEATIQLMNGVMHDMMMTKLKTAAAWTLLALLVGGLGALSYAALANDPGLAQAGGGANEPSAEATLRQALRGTAAASSYAFAIEGDLSITGKYEKGKPAFFKARARLGEKVMDFDIYRSGDRMVYFHDNEWKVPATGRVSDPLWLMAAYAPARAARLPHEELQDIGENLQDARKLEAAKDDAAHFSCALPQGLAQRLVDRSLSDAAQGGEGLFWMDRNGKVVKFTVTVRVARRAVTRTAPEINGRQSHTVELRELGAVRVEVPDVAAKLLGKAGDQ